MRERAGGVAGGAPADGAVVAADADLRGGHDAAVAVGDLAGQRDGVSERPGARRGTRTRRGSTAPRRRRRRWAGWMERIRVEYRVGHVYLPERQTVHDNRRATGIQADDDDGRQCMLSVLRRKAANYALGRSPGSEAAACGDTPRVASPSLAGPSDWIGRQRQVVSKRPASLTVAEPRRTRTGLPRYARRGHPRHRRRYHAAATAAIASSAARTPVIANQCHAPAPGRRGSTRADRPGGRSTRR